MFKYGLKKVTPAEAEFMFEVSDAVPEDERPVITTRLGKKHQVVKNRQIRARHVKEYADLMLDDKFDSLNGETIKLYHNGWIVDGQHRLKAVIVSGKTYQFLVCISDDPASFQYIDQGKPRNCGDILNMIGKSNYAALSATASQLDDYHREKYRFSTSGAKKNAYIADIVDKYPGLEASVEFVGAMKNDMIGFLQPAMMSVIHYLLTQKGMKAEVEEFITQIVFATNLTPGSPTAKLFAKLLKNSRSHSKYQNEYIAAIIIKTWNAEYLGRTIKALSYRPGESFPKILGG